MLLVLLPVALVLRAIQVTVSAAAMRLVVLPVAVVDVAIGVDQSALAIGFVFGPVAFVHAAIGPDLDALALSHIRLAQPLALIARSVLEHDHLATLTLPQALLEHVVIVQERAQLLAHFLDIDIFEVLPLVLHHVVHAVIVHGVLEQLDLLLGHVHAEARLDLRDNPDLLRCVVASVQGGPLGVERGRKVALLARSLLAATVTHY
mmetsp:Transcript_3380/g.3935  ORF Transcript_3380/g.3935 Transcript_3380/m.3935 type:complete len:205 (-) Transcript_3380:27-641(-)